MQGKQLLSDRDVCIYLVIDAGNVVQGDDCYQYEIPGQYCNEKYTDCSLYIFLNCFLLFIFIQGGFETLFWNNLLLNTLPVLCDTNHKK